MKLFLVAVLVALSVENIFCSHLQGQTKLWKKLFDHYNKELEPEDAGLKFGLAFVRAHYEKQSHEVHVHVWERYSWTDKRLSWEPSEFDGVTSLRVSHDHLWLPDFQLYHGFEERVETKALLTHEGHLVYVPAVLYKTHCEKGANHSLHCHFKVGSWGVDAVTLPLAKWDTGATLDYYQTKTSPLEAHLGEVELVTKSYSAFQNLPYSALEVSVDFHHKDSHDDDHHDNDHHDH
uniref:Nicotinic acetylcholine beta subunit-like protein n=1 Tax=Haementeria ghilianii TaxID=6409 RepID=O97141_HAEGH|nr:nicotinic acetylcholine beta subunit-like protein [Haementeria ghilianii]